MKHALAEKGKRRKTFIMHENLAKQVSFEAINRQCRERDVIEEALRFYFLEKDGLELVS